MNKSVAPFGTKTKALQSFTDCFARYSVPPKFKTESHNGRNILKAPRKESQTIRIKKLTYISCSVTFQVFSCDSCFAGKNSGLLQIEIQVFSRLHRVCLLDSTVATCFRRIQAKFHRFYSNFPPPLSSPLSPPGNVLKKFEKITKAHRSRNVLSLM